MVLHLKPPIPYKKTKEEKLLDLMNKYRLVERVKDYITDYSGERRQLSEKLEEMKKEMIKLALEL